MTTWTVPGQPGVTATSDIGAVINSIIAQIKADQPNPASRPGATIYIPPGDYSLKTRVTIDISYLQIKGAGHGFMSLSYRYNSGTSGWAEINPGASRVRVEKTDGNGDAFLVGRSSAPRIASVEFRDFCIDGVNFTPNQNSYLNGKTGIRLSTANDSCRIEGMGFLYLEHGIVAYGADAINITNNFIAECGSCVELTGYGFASKVTNNHVGAGYVGFSVFVEGHEGLLITGNNIFPRGRSMVHLKNASRCSISSNLFHNFYPGMIDMEGGNNNNLIASNHFRRNRENFGVMQAYNNGKDDLYGLIMIRGDDNFVTSNLFYYDVPTANIQPSGARPTIIRVNTGARNQITNNMVSYSNVPFFAVVLDGASTQTKILDSGTAAQIDNQFTNNFTLRPTP
ncbi:right-handed parallel beta-helix repeat-containing protein [Micromonospora sp. BQ11]